jgi:hypothetical protein
MQELFRIMAGAVLAGGFIWFARRRFGYDREKIFYAFGLVVAALIYVGFGLRANSVSWLLVEVGGIVIYMAFAVLGVRRAGWFLSFGWASHALWDLVLHDASTGFVPRWYQLLCLGFDLFLAGYIGFREWTTQNNPAA